MDALARKLRRQRQERGALDLDLPQAVVELDRDDPRLVRDVRRARRDPGERDAYAMIEEFMLAANEAVGAQLPGDARRTPPGASTRSPTRRRSRPSPSWPSATASRFDPAEATTPLGLAAVLKRLRGHPAEKPLSMLLLRALKQATYDVVNVGHFGLASPAYLHFTSPIRRYPDVIVHRLLKHRLASLGKPAGGFAPLAQTSGSRRRDILQRAAEAASFCERKAMEVEREVVDLYRAYFMRDRVGDVLEGSISGVTSFGVFVVMDEPFVEGLVRTDYLLPDDFYDFDEIACRLVGRRSGQHLLARRSREGRDLAGQRGPPAHRAAPLRRAGQSRPRSPAPAGVRRSRRPAAPNGGASRARRTSAGQAAKVGSSDGDEQAARPSSARRARRPPTILETWLPEVVRDRAGPVGGRLTRAPTHAFRLGGGEWEI